LKACGQAGERSSNSALAPFRFLPSGRDETPRTSAPHQAKTAGWRFRGQSFPTGNSSNVVWTRRALLERRSVRSSRHAAMKSTVQVGPGGPVRRQRDGLPCASPEHPWGLSPRGVSTALITARRASRRHRDRASYNAQ
jgi:hypothetical protein